MNCRDVELYLQAYVDGEFGGAEEQEIEQHFKFCPVCQKKVAFALWFKREMKRTVANPPAPQSLKAEVTHLLQNERQRSIPMTWKLAPVAAITLLVLGILFFPRIEVSPPVVEAAVEKHVKNLPFDVQSEDYSTVKEFLQNRLERQVTIPKFKQWRLLGGRVSEVQNHSVAYITYLGNGHRFSLVARPGLESMPMLPKGIKKTINNREILLSKHNGFNVALWNDNQTQYALVSDVDENELATVAGGVEYQF